jgi:NADH-quinone oxidoreductase subunit E
VSEEQEIRSWLSDYFADQGNKTNLISVLLAMQERFGYLPKQGMKEVAARLNIFPANVFGVATFYNQFRLVPPGKYAVKVCMGTACHIKQGTKILEHWQRRLKINVGQVSDDREYSLDRVACVGCCTLAPVTVIGEKVIGEMSPTKIDGQILQHQIKREQEAAQAGRDSDQE